MSKLDSPKLKSVQAAINKKFGPNTVMRMSDATAILAVEVQPTQSLSLNRALGVGGIPRGRSIELYGPEGSGKTGVSLGICAEVINSGGAVAYIDAEHSLDPEYCRVIGVNTNDMLICQPDSAEEGLNVVEALVQTGEIDLIVIDSVAALVPQIEVDKEIGQSTVGRQAALMSQALRKLTGIAAKSKTTLVFINQLREKIGVMHGDPTTTPGGRALKFYASVRIEVRKTEAIKEKDDQIGHKIRCSIKKNKVAPPFKICEYGVIYGQGIDRIEETATIAIEENIVKAAGAWVSLLNDKGETISKWNGKVKFKEALSADPKLYAQIRSAIMSKITSGKSSVVIESETGEDIPDASELSEAEAEQLILS